MLLRHESVKGAESMRVAERRKPTLSSIDICCDIDAVWDSPYDAIEILLLASGT
jgi:hypothetical protein